MEPKVEAAPIFELPAFPGEDQARQIASAGRISHAGIDGPGRAGRIRISGITDSGTRYWEPTTVLPRLGQGSFRLIVTDSYDRRCAFTNSPVLHVLEAAHIRPHGLGGTHAPTNGLLIRQDFHTLFDRGYMTVTPEHHVEVSSRIKQEFDNGREYYALHGKQIRVPQMPDRQPSVESLSVAQRKRLQTVTLGSNQGRWLVERWSENRLLQIALIPCSGGSIGLAYRKIRSFSMTIGHRPQYSVSPSSHARLASSPAQHDDKR